MKVLIVDDHVLFREGLVSVLSSRPEYQVVGEAGTVSEAIQKACLLKPDIILMDFHLSDGTGLEATQAILAELPECKILFLTIEEDERVFFDALRYGAKGFVPKNISVTSLLNSLESMQRGEAAISRAMTTRLVEEFSHTAAAVEPKALERDGSLSPRETDILRELAKGYTNQEIAHQLFLSENTVKHHIHSILTKLELKDRYTAANYARQHKIIG
jgi:DNA-binding NarL/FixJ family response regulator